MTLPSASGRLAIVLILLASVSALPRCSGARSADPSDANPADPDAMPVSDAATPDNGADADCTCTIDAGTDATTARASKSLACHCATFPGHCESSFYERQLSNCRLSLFHSLEFYDACNLIVIRFQGTWDAGGQSVFDTTTHELVGQSMNTDSLAYTCGARLVSGYDAGRFPGSECQLSLRLPGCISGNDGGGNDSGAQVRPSM